MGPKKDQKEPPKEITGAKFAYISVGQRSSPCVLTVNLNCNVEILLDMAKKQLIKKLEEKINALKAIPLESGALPSEADPSPHEEVIKKLMEFQAAIGNDAGEIDLFDSSGAAIGCNQVYAIIFL